MAPLILHASSVSFDGQAVAIIGKSGSGKSTLARRLIVFGGLLVADDRTKVERRGNVLSVSRPDTLPEAIEVRGIGLLKAPVARQSSLALVVDMDVTASDRVAETQSKRIMDCAVPVWPGQGLPDLASAVWLVLTHGMFEPI